jgi:hypothetical protein
MGSFGFEAGADFCGYISAIDVVAMLRGVTSLAGRLHHRAEQRER